MKTYQQATARMEKSLFENEAAILKEIGLPVKISIHATARMDKTLNMK